jgi:hypothetical protein
MQKKTILLVTFIDKEDLTDFLYKIYELFGVKKKSVFFFETEEGDLILTYRLFLDIDEKIDIRKELPKTIQVHKKNTTFLTINSLNKLIEKDFNLSGGNFEHSQYNIDWTKYENCLIILNSNNLEILKLNKTIIE